MSVFGHLMSDASAAIGEVLAERDPHGNFIKITCTLPSGKELELVGVIVGQMAVSRIEGDKGNVVKRETVTINIPLHCNDIERRVYKEARFVIPSFGDRVWVPQAEGSKLNGNFLDYQLERKPLAHQDKKQDATV